MASEAYHRYPPPSSDSSDTIEQRYRDPSHTSDTNEQRHRDPPFSTAEESQKHSPPRYGGNDDSFATPTASRDRRSKRQARYEESIQRAIDQIRNEFSICRTSWSTPLESSLIAICKMAILLKGAQAEAVSDLKLDDLNITNDHGQVCGKLPSRYFNTNIQYCVDIGCLALLNAQGSMDLIRTMSQNMIGKDGKVGCLVDLLEAPEVPLNVLMQKINSLKASAAIWPKTAEKISKRFTHWYNVILHLLRCSLQKSSDLVLQQHDVEREVDEDESARNHWRERGQALESNIEDLMMKLSVEEITLEDARRGVGAPQSTTYSETQNILNRIDGMYQKLSLSQRELVKARANLEESWLQSQQLATKALELTDMRSVLEQSTEFLHTLKAHVEPLVDCFDRFSGGQWISEEVDALLQPLERRFGEELVDPATKVIVRLGRRAKEGMVDVTLRMQGGFSSLSDISEAYITMSSTCIQPAIDQMESLANCSNEDWRAQSDRFMLDSISRCDKIIEIETDATMQARLNMKKQMELLQERAMEVPEEA